MTYATIEKRKYARARKHKLAELWTNCKSRDEFFIYSYVEKNQPSLVVDINQHKYH